MAQIGLDLDSHGLVAWDMQGAYVSGPGGPNAIPAMVRRKFVGETAQKVVRLSDIYRIPIAIECELAEKIDAGTFEINGPKRMQR